MPVTMNDLTMLGDICNTVCYWLTHHLAAVSANVASATPPEVAQIYRLAAALPKPEAAQWAAIAQSKAGGAVVAGVPTATQEPGSRKRLKWTEALGQELVRIVDDEEFRTQQLGKEGTRGGHLNWSSVARYFGFAAPVPVKNKYAELKGMPMDLVPSSKTKKNGESPEDEKPAKKAMKSKVEGSGAAAVAAAAAAPSSPTKKGKEVAAPAPADTPAGEPTSSDAWSKKQQQELVKLVEDEDERKTAFGKKKLRWKRIAEHFGKKSKACRKQYAKASGKEAPEDED